MCPRRECLPLKDLPQPSVYRHCGAGSDCSSASEPPASRSGDASGTLPGPVDLSTEALAVDFEMVEEAALAAGLVRD